MDLILELGFSQNFLRMQKIFQPKCNDFLHNRNILKLRCKNAILDLLHNHNDLMHQCIHFEMGYYH